MRAKYKQDSWKPIDIKYFLNIQKIERSIDNEIASLKLGVQGSANYA